MKTKTAFATTKLILPKRHSAAPRYFFRSEFEVSAESSHQKKALVVDDDRAIRRAVRYFLERRLNLKVYVAANGAEGIRQARDHQFDLIISDVNMPIMDGITFYDWLHKNQPQSIDRFIFMTGGPDLDVDIHSFRGGKVKIIDKPFTMDLFLDSCHSILRA